jgi:chromosome segregation ATPase
VAAGGHRRGIVGVLAGVIFFLAQYMAREKNAWTALESKLRGEAFKVEGLRQEIAALQARIKSNQEEIGALRARLDVTAADRTAGTTHNSEW